jgi:hypothetical protein
MKPPGSLSLDEVREVLGIARKLAQSSCHEPEVNWDDEASAHVAVGDRCFYCTKAEPGHMDGCLYDRLRELFDE